MAWVTFVGQPYFFNSMGLYLTTVLQKIFDGGGKEEIHHRFHKLSSLFRVCTLGCRHVFPCPCTIYLCVH